ncbi:ATP synthase F1 subunit delta [Weeksellaceae bacterium TAE3-ERU29]|nr:ATP synthase F1 subunit delta [Weeksellaceae bacterium TAE3-ERU29]
MANYRVAKRYAKAFMEVLPAERQEVVIGEMRDIIKSLKANKNLRAFLGSPIISEEKKLSISKDIFKAFSNETQNLIMLLIKNGRSENLKEVANSVIEQYRTLNGIKKAIITSATPLTEEQLNDIVQEVTRNLAIESKKIEVEQKIDESLIGGFILRVDDKQFDTSIKTRLNKIKQEFDTKQIIS